MEKSIFEQIVAFVNRHFELLFYISGYLILLLILLAAAIKLRELSLRKVLLSTVHGVLLLSVMVGQIVLLGMLGYLYWQNYNRPAPVLSLGKNLIATTHWIKDNKKVYFIDDQTLRSIWLNGKDEKVILQSDSLIAAYHFSPDGNYIAVVTQNDLVLVNQATNKSQVIDTLKQASQSGQKAADDSISGSISGLQWSPDSRKLCYEVSRWSKFGSQDNVYIYSVKDSAKQSIISPTRRISSLYWDIQSENLYYIRHETQDTTIHASAFEVKVFRIALTTLTPEFITQVPYDNMSIPTENLKARGIYLFTDGPKLSFSLAQNENYLKSDNGASVGVDEDDYLYFTDSKWFRRRLFKIPREERVAYDFKYQYKSGDLVVDQIRWIPGGRYVIMEHKYWGVIILEPVSGQTGVLVEASGRAFGWYQELGI